MVEALVQDAEKERFLRCLKMKFYRTVGRTNPKEFGENG